MDALAKERHVLPSEKMGDNVVGTPAEEHPGDVKTDSVK